MRRLRRNLTLFAFGACASAAMPPLYVLPLLAVAFSGLLLVLARADSGRRAFADGWWFGLGHFTTGLYWMCIALLTDPARFGWLIPFTLIGLNGLFALFPALACLAFHWLRRQRGHHAPNLADALLFAAIWAVSDYARGHVLTGFPWNLPAYALGFSEAMPQAAATLGAYGLSFLVLLACALPAVTVYRGRKYRAAGGVACILAFLAIDAAGEHRLPPRESTAIQPGVQLRLVQANISQHHKWDPVKLRENLRRLAELTRTPGYDATTHVIWPETAVPYFLNREPELIRMLRDLAPRGGALLTGTLRAEGGDEDFRLWNSLAVLTHAEGISAWYDKHHLVPFGEFVPMRSLLPIEKITHGGTDFSRGPGPQTLALPGAPLTFSPLICYEAIFPQEAVETSAPRPARPDFLLNITNDAWFGLSSGPYQHFQSARFRAIEQGVPLVRSAGTGISAVTDPYGRTIALLPLQISGVLDSVLPKPLPHDTIYGSYGDKIFLLLIIASAIFYVFLRNSRI